MKIIYAKIEKCIQCLHIDYDITPNQSRLGVPGKFICIHLDNKDHEDEELDGSKSGGKIYGDFKIPEWCNLPNQDEWKEEYENERE